jgi:transcriptional/translational regulatory protein YebC/TACO1
VFLPNIVAKPKFLRFKLIDIMEDDDDVQNVWHNWEQE